MFKSMAQEIFTSLCFCFFSSDDRHAPPTKKSKDDDDKEEEEDLNDANYDEVCSS